jgi:predicted CXXCH cytochrome family protein
VTFRLWSLVAALIACGSATAAMDVLFPADGQRVSGSGVWLVVEAAAPPLVSVDGRRLDTAGSDEGVYHSRLEGLRGEGSEVRVEGDTSTARLLVFGGADEPTRFHDAAHDACAACHDLGASGCVACHRWEGAKHAPVLAEGCSRCHRPPQWEVGDIADICGTCHNRHANGKHPRLRHPLESPRDPLRPRRKMDCASCHDPHTPTCLGCLGRGELRKWCLRCHSKP